MSRFNRLAARFLAGTLALAALACVAPPAIAQNQNNANNNALTPPVPTPPRTPPSHLTGVLTGLLLGALVVGVNFLPSKRGHQD